VFLGLSLVAPCGKNLLSHAPFYISRDLQEKIKNLIPDEETLTDNKEVTNDKIKNLISGQDKEPCNQPESMQGSLLVLILLTAIPPW